MITSLVYEAAGAFVVRVRGVIPKTMREIPASVSMGIRAYVEVKNSEGQLATDTAGANWIYLSEMRKGSTHVRKLLEMTDDGDVKGKITVEVLSTNFPFSRIEKKPPEWRMTAKNAKYVKNLELRAINASMYHYERDWKPMNKAASMIRCWYYQTDIATIPGSAFSMLKPKVVTSPVVWQHFLQIVLERNNRDTRWFTSALRTQLKSKRPSVSKIFNQAMMIICELLSLAEISCPYLQDVNWRSSSGRRSPVEQFISWRLKCTADCEDVAQSIYCNIHGIMCVEHETTEMRLVKEVLSHYTPLMTQAAVTTMNVLELKKNPSSRDIMCHTFVLLLPTKYVSKSLKIDYSGPAWSNNLEIFFVEGTGHLEAGLQYRSYYDDDLSRARKISELAKSRDDLAEFVPSSHKFSTKVYNTIVEESPGRKSPFYYTLVTGYFADTLEKCGAESSHFHKDLAFSDCVFLNKRTRRYGVTVRDILDDRDSYEIVPTCRWTKKQIMGMREVMSMLEPIPALQMIPEERVDHMRRKADGILRRGLGYRLVSGIVERDLKTMVFTFGVRYMDLVNNRSVVSTIEELAIKHGGLIHYVFRPIAMCGDHAIATIDIQLV